MRCVTLCALVALLFVGTPAGAQEESVRSIEPSIRVGSYVRVEYTRYFARRREIVDSTELARATRSRRVERSGFVDDITPTHIEMHAHDRSWSIPRWQIDRTWAYVHTATSDHPAESVGEWSMGGVVAAALVGALGVAACDDSDEYCGLAVAILAVPLVGLAIIGGVIAGADDTEDDFVEVDWP